MIKADEMRKVIATQLHDGDKVYEALNEDWYTMNRVGAIDNWVRRPLEQREVKALIHEHYVQLSELFKTYGAAGASLGTTHEMEFGEFSQFCYDADVFGALQPPWMRRPELSSPMAVQYFTLVVAPATLLVGTAWRPLSTPLFLFGALATAAHAFDEYPAWTELLPPKAWEDLLGGPTVKYSGGHLAGADVEPLMRADGSFNVNRAEDPSGERRSQIDRTLFRGRAAVRYLAVWNAPACPDRPLTAPEKARGPWTTKDYLSRVLQETSNEMVDALLAATQADLINAFCRMLSISGCFLLFAVRRPRGAAASKKEKVA